jgi:hypothetical protein
MDANLLPFCPCFFHLPRSSQVYDTSFSLINLRFTYVGTFLHLGELDGGDITISNCQCDFADPFAPFMRMTQLANSVVTMTNITHDYVISILTISDMISNSNVSITKCNFLHAPTAVRGLILPPIVTNSQITFDQSTFEFQSFASYIDINTTGTV